MPLLYPTYTFSTFVSPYPSPPPSPPSPPSESMLRRLLRSRESSVDRGSLSETERASAITTAQARLLEPQLSTTINRHLAAVHNTGRRSKVLDVGIRYVVPKLLDSQLFAKLSDTWAVALANQQPFADVTAVDIDWSHFQPIPLQHGNVDFETVALQDMTQPLPYHPNSFDVVHVSNMLLELPQYAALIERLAVILQPGGLLVIVETEPRFLSETGEMSRDARTWDACVSESCRARGIDVDLPASLGARIAATGLFMGPPVTQERFLYAAGASRHNVENLANRGQLHQAVVEASLRGMIPSMEAHGYATQDLYRLLQACVTEIGGSRGKCYQRLFAVYAHKALHY